MGGTKKYNPRAAPSRVVTTLGPKPPNQELKITAGKKVRYGAARPNSGPRI
jgi:hypothetical protein